MNTIEKLLSDYRKYLLSRSLAKKSHVPCLVKWVARFLLFAGGKNRETFDNVLALLRRELEEHNGLEEWQVRQAIDAVIIYRHQFRKAGTTGGPGGAPLDPDRTLRAARRLCRLKRYARSTEKTYLAWIRRLSSGSRVPAAGA